MKLDAGRDGDACYLERHRSLGHFSCWMASRRSEQCWPVALGCVAKAAISAHSVGHCTHYLE